MRQLTNAALGLAATLTLTACGGNGSANATSQAAPRSPSATVSVKNVPDVGKALVTGSGMTLYTPDLEASGTIHCTATCTSFWKPLAPTGDAPTAHGNTGKLAIIKRPDGSRQVTSNGRPLYTFAEDGPGDAKGDGFTDVFAGRRFVWHAVSVGRTPPASHTTSGQPSSGSHRSGGGYAAGGY